LRASVRDIHWNAAIGRDHAARINEDLDLERTLLHNLSASESGGLFMDYDPVFSNKSTAELNSCLIKYTEENEFHARALTELSKREKLAEDKIASQFSKAIFWSRLAAILALPGALYVIWRIVLSIHTL
jgi:hypothetical protein